MIRILVLIMMTCVNVSVAHAAETAPRWCEQQLVRGGYCLESQAEIVCQMMPRPVISCAMDMVDMKLAPDIFDAVEYCRFPYPAPKGP